MTIAEYMKGGSLPDIALTWLEEDGSIIPLGTGHTLEAKIGPRAGQPAQLTKTVGLGGADTAPNVIIQWRTNPTEDLNVLDPGHYLVQVTATRTADGKRRTLWPLLPLILRPAIT